MIIVFHGRFLKVSFVRCVEGLIFNVLMWYIVDLLVFSKIKNEDLKDIWFVYQIIYIFVAIAQMCCLYYLSKKLIGDHGKDESVASDIVIDDDKQAPMSFEIL